MSEITSIKPTAKDPTRASIKVDGRFVGALPHARVVELGFAVGRQWSADDQQKLDAALAYDKAWRDAMRPLNRRALSGKQLRDKLTEKGHAPKTIDAVQARLEELGVMDDLSYGRSLIRQTMSRKAAGPRLLRQKLMQKGVERSLIDKLLAEACGDQPDNQVDAAAELVEKKLRTVSMQRLEPAEQKRKLWGMLARRGFEVDTIRRALESIRVDDDVY